MNISKNLRQQKFDLNKKTICNLSRADLNEIAAGLNKNDGCWENLWTVYHCDVVYTGAPTKDVNTTI